MSSRLYVETTIISYLAAMPSRDLIVAAHQQLTHDWWFEKRQEFDLYASELVRQEAAEGDPDATAEAMTLADALVKRGAVPASAAEDAAHIAIATVHGMDYVLTWNCKHIANARLEKKIEGICFDEGYELPVICTPEELIGG